MRLTILAVAAYTLLLGACTPTSKYFRKLGAGEAGFVKAAEKQYGKLHDAYRVLVLTDSGNMLLRLYNETPLHRDNFVAKVKAGFYDSLLFHRVIKNFMIQGGDPTSKHAVLGEVLGSGEAPGGRIAAEIRTDQGYYHKKGALAAARDDNAAKASSNSQFYITQGKVFTPAQLEADAKARGYKLSDAQKKLYTSVGGTPHLDNNYTVYGELEYGSEVLDKIAEAKTALGNRPMENIRMRMFVVSEWKGPAKPGQGRRADR